MKEDDFIRISVTITPLGFQINGREEPYYEKIGDRVIVDLRGYRGEPKVFVRNGLLFVIAGRQRLRIPVGDRKIKETRFNNGILEIILA